MILPTIEHPGPFDALEKADPNEPMFPLLGRDADAPATITEWCRLRRNRAIRKYGTDPAEGSREQLLLKAELEQCRNAEEIAIGMAEYRLNLAAPKDQPEAKADAEVAKTAEELEQAQRRSESDSACRHLREAAYHLCEARDMLAKLDDEDVDTLSVMLKVLNAFADDHEARRAQPVRKGD